MSVADGMVTVEWEGTGPGVEPEDTVDLFTCEINSNAPRSCESAFYPAQICVAAGIFAFISSLRCSASMYIESSSLFVVWVMAVI